MRGELTSRFGIDKNVPLCDIAAEFKTSQRKGIQMPRPGRLERALASRILDIQHDDEAHPSYGLIPRVGEGGNIHIAEDRTTSLAKFVRSNPELFGAAQGNLNFDLMRLETETMPKKVEYKTEPREFGPERYGGIHDTVRGLRSDVGRQDFRLRIDAAQIEALRYFDRLSEMLQSAMMVMGRPAVSPIHSHMRPHQIMREVGEVMRQLDQLTDHDDESPENNAAIGIARNIASVVKSMTDGALAAHIIRAKKGDDRPAMLKITEAGSDAQLYLGGNPDASASAKEPMDPFELLNPRDVSAGQSYAIPPNTPFMAWGSMNGFLINPSGRVVQAIVAEEIPEAARKAPLSGHKLRPLTAPAFERIGEAMYKLDETPVKGLTISTILFMGERDNIEIVPPTGGLLGMRLNGAAYAGVNGISSPSLLPWTFALLPGAGVPHMITGQSGAAVMLIGPLVR